MIFVFAEDGTLAIVEDLDEVRRSCEPIDVESDVYRFYDEAGRTLRPKFTKPNNVKRFLGIKTLEQGEYVLEVDTGSNLDPIEVALVETAALEPNRWFRDLDSVRRYVAEQRG